VRQDRCLPVKFPLGSPRMLTWAHLHRCDEHLIRVHIYARCGIFARALPVLPAIIVQPFPIVLIGNQIADSVGYQQPGRWTIDLVQNVQFWLTQLAPCARIAAMRLHRGATLTAKQNQPKSPAPTTGTDDMAHVRLAVAADGDARARGPLA
jgi:hypothetical protein